MHLSRVYLLFNDLYSDSGSRGAGGVKNTIKNYFVPQGESAAGSGTAAGPANFHHINRDKEKDKESLGKDPNNPIDPLVALMPPPAKIPSATNNSGGAGKPGPITTQQVNTIIELKKQAELFKYSKELAESRVILNLLSFDAYFS